MDICGSSVCDLLYVTHLGNQNFEVAYRFLYNLCTHGEQVKIYVSKQLKPCYVRGDEKATESVLVKTGQGIK